MSELLFSEFSELTGLVISDSKFRAFQSPLVAKTQNLNISGIASKDLYQTISANWSSEDSRAELLSLLPRFEKVTSLTIIHLHSVTLSFASQILKFFPNLHRLTLGDLFPREDESDSEFFKNIQCPLLTHLKFFNHRISSPEDIKILLSRSTISKLEFINCIAMNAETFKSIADNGKNLEYLGFNCLPLREDDLTEILEKNKETLIVLEVIQTLCSNDFVLSILEKYPRICVGGIGSFR